MKRRITIALGLSLGLSLASAAGAAALPTVRTSSPGLCAGAYGTDVAFCLSNPLPDVRGLLP